MSLQRYDTWTDMDGMREIERDKKGPWYKYEDVQNLLNHIASMCGNPDPAEACRAIIKKCEEARG